MMKHIIIFILLVTSSTPLFAERQTIGNKGEMIQQLKQLDVFLIQTIANIDKGKKKDIELKVMNYGIHNCTLIGKAWQENTRTFQAFLVQTEYLKCADKIYPASFYSRVIAAQRLSLNSTTNYGSFAKSGLEIFLIKMKSVLPEKSKAANPAPAGNTLALQ